MYHTRPLLCRCLLLQPQMTVEEYEEYRREVEQRRRENRKRRPFWMRDEDDDAAGRYRFKQNRPNPPLPPPPPPPKAEASGALDGNNDGFIDMGELRRAQTSAGGGGSSFCAAESPRNPCAKCSREEDCGARQPGILRCRSGTSGRGCDRGRAPNVPSTSFCEIASPINRCEACVAESDCGVPKLGVVRCRGGAYGEGCAQGKALDDGEQELASTRSRSELGAHWGVAAGGALGGLLLSAALVRLASQREAKNPKGRVGMRYRR